MRVVAVDQPGGEEVLRITEVPAPSLAEGEVRIQVAAAGVNRADLLQRRGLYPPPPGVTSTLGLECAGTISELGPEVSGWTVGDRVMALLAGGAYAEQVVAPASCLMAVPPGLAIEPAAGMPEAFLTAYLNLFVLGRLEPGQCALVHGGSGGVGTAAIQLIKRAGAGLVVTAGGAERCRRCLELGADAAIDHRSGDLEEAVQSVTGGRGVAVVLDCIGGPYLASHLRLLAAGGRLVVIGLMGGARAELNLAALLGKGLSIIGSTLRGRPAAEKGQLIEAFLSRFGTAIADGTIGPVIDRILPLQEVAEAHRLLAAGEIFGKLLLRCT